MENLRAYLRAYIWFSRLVIGFALLSFKIRCTHLLSLGFRGILLNNSVKGFETLNFVSSRPPTNNSKLLGDAIALCKVKRHTIDAIAQSMGRRAIREHMPQMTLAMAADQLNPSHPVFEVFFRLD